MIVSTIGAAILISASFVTFYSLSAKAWLLVAAAGLIAVGFMLTGSGLPGKAAVVGDVLFFATPGGLLAAVAFTFAAYLPPDNSGYQIFLLTWIGLAVLGLLWVFVGPIVMYRVKTRLWVRASDPQSNGSVTVRAAEKDRSDPRIVAANWAIVAATIVGPIIAVILAHYLGS
jgi:hypothetical protein